MKKSPVKFFLSLGLLGAGASMFIFWVMAHGPGRTSDSAVYIETAKSILAGNGFCIQGKPITHWPPFYPLILAGSALLIPDIAQSVRYLHAIILGINVILIGLAFYISKERRIIVVVCAVLLFLFFPTTLLVHSTMWSEAPFIMFTLCGFLFLSLYFNNQNLPLLLASAISLGLAMTIRYTGVVLMFSAIVTLIIFGHSYKRKKIFDIVIFMLIAAAPLCFWLFRNVLIAGNATNRRFAWHPISLENVKTLIMNISIFIIPISMPIGIYIRFIFDVLFFVLVTAAFIITYRNNIHDQSIGQPILVFPFLCFLFFLGYLIFILISKCCFDASIPLDERILFPAFVSLVIAVVGLAIPTFQYLQKSAIRRIFIVFLVIFAILNCIRGSLAAVKLREGVRFTSPEYKYYNSETIYILRKFPVNTEIYSNLAYSINFLTDNKAVFLPFKKNPSTYIVNEHYKEEMESICRYCRESKAIIVYFYLMRKWYLPTQEEIESTCNLHILYKLSDGIIYTGRKE